MFHLTGKRSCHGQVGTDGSTMEQDQTPSAASDKIAQGRTPAGGPSGVLRRHPVDPSQRRKMEGFAGAIPLFQHLLASPPRLGRSRGVAEDLADFPGRTRRTGATGLGRDLRRRQLCAGKKRGACVGKTKRGKGTKWMVVASGQGIPMGVQLASASPHETTLIESMLEQVSVPRRRGRPRKNPTRLIYDKGGDSDPLRNRLKKRGIELICPHKSNRRKPPSQDGRKLRRYKRRWKMERSIAWLGNFRRLVVRYEHKISIYQA